MKSVTKLMMVLGLLLGLSQKVMAATTENITVTIAPSAFYSISIDTASVDMDLGTVDLGASTQTVLPATVTVNSTFSTTDIQLAGSIDSTGTNWTFDSNTATQEADVLAAWATFTDTTVSTAPAQSGDNFDGTVPGAAGSDVVDANTRYVGSSAGDSTTDLFEDGSKNMDSLPPDPDANAKAHMYMYFRLPSASTSADAQNITFTLTAVVPN